MRRREWLIVGIAVAAIIGVVIFQLTSRGQQTAGPKPSRSHISTEQAIKEAENYRPDGMCTTVMTPARHIDSGATYTFLSGCLPNGWERIQTGNIQQDQ